MEDRRINLRDGTGSSSSSSSLGQKRPRQSTEVNENEPSEDSFLQSRIPRRHAQEEGSAAQSSSVASSSTSRSQLFQDGPSILAPATMMASNDSDSPSKPLVPSSSLFGAVMKNVNQIQQQPTTPKASSSAVSRRDIGTPGGFQLQDFVNSINSPFHHLASSASPAGSTLSAHDEWQETTVGDDTFHLVDWSLKRSLQFECQPRLRMARNVSIQQQARRRFLTTGTNLKREESSSCSSSAVRFEAGLLYWRYQPMPAIKSHHRSTTEETNTINNTYFGSSRLETADRSMPPPFRTAKATTTNQQQAFAKRQEHSKQHAEWQQAFRSLYMTWIQKIRGLSEDDLSSIDSCYFYACGKGHVALFRAGLVEKEVVPQVVLSSCGPAVREKLKHMGVKLRLLEEWEGNVVFDEDVLKPAPIKEGADTSPAVKEELIALRRAQVTGQTVGADVSVSIKGRSSAMQSPRRIPPILLSGEDDCATFCEVYLNSGGQMHRGRKQSLRSDVADVLPVLYTRGLGPFDHATLERSQVVERRHARDNLVIEGTILPCSVRELVSAVIEDILSEAPEDENDEIGCRHMIVRAENHEGIEIQPVSGTIGWHSSKFMNTRSFTSGYHKSCRFGETLSMAVWDASRPTEIAYKLNLETAFSG